MDSKNYVLRDYQVEMKSRLFEEWTRHRSVMVQMPTGTGKTHLLTAVVREALHRPDSRIWIVAHRRELVEQIEATIARYGIDRENGAVKVMSIQWLSRHWKEMEGKPDLIVIDEAHHSLADTYMELWRKCPDARMLGMTATPCRLNRKGFTGLFDTLITSWSIAEFIGKGWLSVFDYVSIRANSREQRLIDTLKKRGADGDYQVKEMNELLNRQPSIERLYASIERYARGKKGIVYAISIAHARRIAAYYSTRGVEAVAIDSKTPAIERKRLVDDFRQGRIKVLVNVDIFSEGFDCPDVEFIQLARPTLSLAKYLQQVGRGLRKSGDKESCILIDNVGLYRIFGLPTREWDWEAMFEGRMIGNALSQARINSCRVSADLPERVEATDNEMEIVMTHNRLMDDIENRKTASGEEAQSALKAYYDRQNGLWGLKRGEKRVAESRYLEVFDTKGNRAAVRFEDGRTGVVDEAGKQLIKIDCYRKIKFAKDDIMVVTDKAGKVFYIDLKVNRIYRERPAVLRFGSVEMLKVGDVFFSRTKKAYVTSPLLDKRELIFIGFYLRIPDYNIPKNCKLVNPAEGGFFRAFVCLLEGDNEEAYWCCGHLEDKSIVVMDRKGNYYHAERGKKKQYIACNAPKSPQEDFDYVIGKLKEKTGLRAEKNQEREMLEEEQKRQQRLIKIKDALPFQMGMKWGLKSGERIVVPPQYRKIMPPVGNFCAYEENAYQWGVMALDGKVMVEAKYQEVDIERNGTVHLTVFPGKVKTIKL
ncbi:DEAD/DEAH box helicase [Bacteroides helcogenes]|uniref:Type III restriction protein res subunit n=1 Tax=Bacteroides helcogenes (strain ATCC 35417 / DSM 20613 / JCM 6297 / CCUG 15421 / P 36-108) TaxID=693979 RepID=E6SPC9_BACT6|nr:DEAD/DEAH box helicase [Bacteroides helcogenes]ADV44886.1 type III restriction protein res subunit [Bacteroides helcogenes P 36-108]MDY5239743.1 DEAD/DEAH box helicase [Bacteroides helcogenes]